MTERYSLLGLATARSPWFADVGRWASSARLPIDFVKCLSAEELRARLTGGRRFSLVMVDSGTPGFDRDIIDLATSIGTAVTVVDGGSATRDWVAMGAIASLEPGFDEDRLLEILARFGQPLGGADQGDAHTAEVPPLPSALGHLVTVTGSSGAGASTLAMALGQGLGAAPEPAGPILVADFCLDADLALLHDARDVVPGLQELVEAHRRGTPTDPEIRGLLFDVEDRGYHLMLGLRRHRDWTVLRPRSLHGALDSLIGAYGVVVADTEPDLEGEREVGSVDIEERNLLARTCVARADVVVAVGNASVKGIHGLLRVVASLLDFGTQPGAILPVMNRSGRSVRQQAAATAAFGELVAPLSTDVASPIHVPDHRRLEDVTRDSRPLPSAVTEPIASAVRGAIARLPEAPKHHAVEPEAVRPGALGHLTGEATA